MQAAAELIREFQGSGDPVAVIVEPENRWIVPTLGDVAEFLGVEVSTVWGWRTGANQMPGAEGRWDLQEITQWRCTRLKAASGQVKSARQLELEEQEQEIKVTRDRAKLRKELGELVSRPVAKAAQAAQLNDIRVLLEGVAEVIGASVPPEFKNIVVREVQQQVSLICQFMANKAKG